MESEVVRWKDECTNKIGATLESSLALEREHIKSTLTQLLVHHLKGNKD